MSRPRTYTVAVVLLVLFSLIAFLGELPRLAQGDVGGDDAPPFALTIVNFTLAILGFVAAYGVWRVQKWAVIFAIVICALSILTSLPAIIFAPILVLRLLGIVSIVWLVAIIALLLRPTTTTQRSMQQGGQPAMSSVE